MQNVTFYQHNSGNIQLTGLIDRSQTPPVSVNNASSIVATLSDPNGDPVPGFTDVAGTYMSGSNGNYAFPVTESFNPPTGGGYTLVVDVTVPSGAVGHWEIPAVVVVRGTGAGSN